MQRRLPEHCAHQRPADRGAARDLLIASTPEGVVDGSRTQPLVVVDPKLPARQHPGCGGATERRWQES
jgi:hypothetical protein